MANKAVTESVIEALNTIKEVVSTAATADSADGLAEVFEIVPTSDKLVVIIGGTGAAADGDISYSFAAGDLPQAKAITGTVTKNTEMVIQIDTARVMNDDGKILLTLTPAATDKLVTNHVAYVKVIELI